MIAASLEYRSRTDDRTGRVVYSVPGVGSFTVEPAETAPWAPFARVTFGDVGNREHGQLDVLPDAPVVNGCTLLGHVLRPVTPHQSVVDRLQVMRSMEPHYAVLVSDDTCDRVRAMLRVLLADWAGRPDLHTLRTAHEQWRAQFRSLTATCRVAEAEVRLAAAQAELDAARAEDRRITELMTAFDLRTGLA